MRVVVFDIYGTLLTSDAGEQIPDDTVTRQLIKAEILRQHRSSPHPHPEIEIRHVWAQVFPEKSPQEIERKIIAEQRQHFPVTAMPGAVEVLHALKQQGIPIGLISNAQFYTLPMLTDALGPLHDLGIHPELICESWHHLRAKPDSWLYQQMRERLEERGIPASEVLYIGNDVRNDIQPAKSVGFRTALYAGDPRSLRWRGTTAETCGADHILSNLMDCLKVLPSP
jgi:putative hydrolase of the HAD superfamily